jgi:hypothetical protein
MIARPTRAEDEALQLASGHQIQLTTYRDHDDAPKTVTSERETSHNVERRPPTVKALRLGRWHGAEEH